MTSKKQSHSHNDGSKMSPELTDMLSKQIQNKEKSEKQHYPPPDIRDEVRKEHLNGSKPADRL